MEHSTIARENLATSIYPGYVILSCPSCKESARVYLSCLQVEHLLKQHLLTPFCAGCGSPWSLSWSPRELTKSEGITPSAGISRLRQHMRGEMDSPHTPRVSPWSHIIVQARAGCGKTSSLIQGVRSLKGLPTAFAPSPQQEALWAEMAKFRADTIGMVAFNKNIATELQAQSPPGVQAMTIHSMGYKAVRGSFGNCQPVPQRVSRILCDMLGSTFYEVGRRYKGLIAAVSSVVSLCKLTLTEPSPSAISELVSRYCIEYPAGIRGPLYDLVPRIYEECKVVRGEIDYDDMVWLPVIHNLVLTRYDLLMVDESQDLNRCQQELVLQAGCRFIFVGDRAQAIYGFAGADTSSMDRVEEVLRASDEGVVILPLTVTRRCGSRIVEEAKRLVPDIEAHESNGVGEVVTSLYPLQKRNGEVTELPISDTYIPLVQDGDFVLCRCNAPLVSNCFRFLKLGRKATIRGRDVGHGLITLLEKLSTKSMSREDLIVSVREWKDKEVQCERRCPSPNDAKILSIEDRADCLLHFIDAVASQPQGEPVAGKSASPEEEIDYIAEVKARIESIFTDNQDSLGVRLSSIHKAKGLESDNVFLLLPYNAPIPHPMAKADWAIEQEYNLLYVAITRAKKKLVYVK